MDGKEVDEGSYTAKAGSVVVTLSPEYLETLSVGSHTITARFEDGSATAGFTVVGEERQSNGEDNYPVKKNSTTPTETNSTTPAETSSTTSTKTNSTGSSNGTSTRATPKTGDASDPAIWLSLMFAAAGLLFAGTTRRRMIG